MKPSEPTIQWVKGSGTVDGKVYPRTGHKRPEGEWIYSSTISLTSALDGNGLSTQSPGSFTPRNTRYLLYRRMGGHQGRSGRVRKTSHTPGFDPRTVRPLASRYTDFAFPAVLFNGYWR